MFRETARDWGIDFRHHHGGSGRHYMVETMVGGVLAFDADGDGDNDLLFVDGGPLPGYQGETPRSRLYRNEGGGRFLELTARSPLPLDDSFYGCGGTAGDVDGDGDLDLYLTAFGPDRLLLNRGDGTFEDATANAGLSGSAPWTAGSAFADYDRDGDLDLFVAGYVNFSLDNHRFCGDQNAGVRSYCHPGVYEPEPDRLFRNRGDGTFEDVTTAAGLHRGRGAGLGVIFSDLDLDDLSDLYVANDETPNFLYRNRGDGTFEDLSLLSGTAYSDRGRPEAGMGVDLGDFDGNGTPDIVVTNFELETNALYINQGSGLFSDARWTSGLAEPSLVRLGFGIGWLDADHDGDLDLAVANGHILDNAEVFREGSKFRQPNQLFENLGQGRLREVGDSGLETTERASRGLALADLDGDGDLDLVIASSNDLAEVYENRAGSRRGRWLQVDLRSDSGNRRGIGSRLEARAGNQRHTREVRTASSYLSQNPLTAHFGLGSAAGVDELVVRWPDGRRQTLRSLPTNRRLQVYRRGPDTVATKQASEP